MNLFRKHAPGVFSREGGVDMTRSSQLLRHRRSVMDQISAAAVAYNQDFTHKVIIIDQPINLPLNDDLSVICSAR